jgi:hypothetical protein
LVPLPQDSSVNLDSGSITDEGKLPVTFANFKALDDTMKCVGSAGNFRLTRRHYKRPKRDDFVRGTYHCSGPILDPGEKAWVVAFATTPAAECVLRASVLGVCPLPGATQPTSGSPSIVSTARRSGRQAGKIPGTASGKTTRPKSRKSSRAHVHRQHTSSRRCVILAVSPHALV